MTDKKKAGTACSRYIRLRDALAYCKEKGIDGRLYDRPEELPVKCCTCEVVKSWIRMHAGHYFGRGLGGSSGTYFDERNIHTQCKQCNAFRGGNIQVYDRFMLEKYDQKVIDELEILHRCGQKFNYIGLRMLFEELYKDLVREID